jgi:outer membrane protein TolC
MGNPMANVTFLTRFLKTLRQILFFKGIKNALLIASTSLCQHALANPKIQLTDQEIINLIKTRSLNVKEQNLKLSQADLSLENTLKPFNWKVALDLSQEIDRSDSLSTLAANPSNKSRGLATLYKRLPVGANLGVEYLHTDFRTESSSSEYNQQSFSFVWEQNLWPFFKTNVDASSIENAELKRKKDRLQWKMDETQAVRNVLSLYWQIKALTVSIAENTAVFQKYERLISSIEKKRANNFAAAGEYEQAMAEYLLKKQTLSEERTLLAKRLTDLKVELDLPPASDLSIDPTLAPISPPSKISLSPSQTSLFLQQKYKTLIAEKDLEIAESDTSGQWSLYTRVTPAGVDEKSSPAFTEMSSANKNKFLIGVKFSKDLEDLSSKKEAELKSASLVIEQDKLNILNQSIEQQLESQYQILLDSFKAIETQQSVVKFRAEALNSISKNYQQGRIDISVLIDTYSRMVNSKVSLAKAYADYYDRWLAYSSLTYNGSETPIANQ